MRKSVRYVANGGLVAVSLIVSFLAAEAALFVHAGYKGGGTSGIYQYEDLYVSSRPISVFDRISGYRRPSEPTRIVRIVRDELVFDQTFTPNNAGYITSRDFTHRKGDPATKRIIVLGDSFTAAEFNPVPWPDRVHDALKGRTDQPMELYSFAVNGGGLGNWSTIFSDDIVPNYAFDALLIATYGDDLARGFSYLHYDGPRAYIGYFPTRASSDEDFFTNYLPKMARHKVLVASNEEIDGMIASLGAPWHWPGMTVRTVPLAAAQWKKMRPHMSPVVMVSPVRPAGSANDMGILDIEARYGETQFGLLRRMMEYCAANGIPVIFASVPGSDGAQAVARGMGETHHQRETRALAEYFGALYFDGYAPFAALPPESIDPVYWLKYDRHWNQKGSDVFASAITDFLIAHQGALRRKEHQE